MFQPPKTEPVPFLKWAGGKRWLYLTYPELLPETYNHYIEPFAGGASIFFALAPKRALLSDANMNLIACYEQMRDNTAALYAAMLRHHRLHSDAYYYEMRSRKCRTPLTRAAKFLYLNRTCWNGLYRVNLKGEFNVPRGTKSTVVFDGENFHSYAKTLRNAVLLSCDFSRALAKAKEGDFVFVDPPYTVKHNYNGFKKYNENIFSWQDQVRLLECVEKAAERGAKILLCNANHDDILKLYEGLGSQHILHRKSLIAGGSAFRSGTSEVAITLNFEPKKFNSRTNNTINHGNLKNAIL